MKVSFYYIFLIFLNKSFSYLFQNNFNQIIEEEIQEEIQEENNFGYLYDDDDFKLSNYFNFDYTNYLTKYFNSNNNNNKNNNNNDDNNNDESKDDDLFQILEISYFTIFNGNFYIDINLLYQIWYGDDTYDDDDYLASYYFWPIETDINQSPPTTLPQTKQESNGNNIQRKLRSNIILSTNKISSLLLNDMLTHQLSWIFLAISCGMFAILLGKYLRHQ